MKSRQPTDVFADIAEQGEKTTRMPLCENNGPLITPYSLPCRTPDPAAAFRPLRKIDRPDLLQKELARQRKRYLPFLANHAPIPPATRRQIALTAFEWRIEKALSHGLGYEPLAGQTDWQPVSIPHYGPPLGRAVTCYRTSLNIPAEMLNQRLWLCFKGVDYKTHAFVNDHYVGSHEGFFAPFEFDVTETVVAGVNTVTVRVENDAICMGNRSWGDNGHLFEGDKLYAATGLGYNDPQIGWHHCPPAMGIYNSVFIESRPVVSIHDIFVRPLPEQSAAEAWVEIYNTDALEHPIEVRLSLYGQNFKSTIFSRKPFNEVAPAGSRLNTYRLKFHIPRLRQWELDSPWLYQLQVCVQDKDSKVEDIQTKQFGMRTFRMDENSSPKGMFFLNDRPIRLRGANTMGFEQQDVLHRNFSQLIDDILLAKICHMNFWRLTQRPVQEEVYDYCDRLGLMVQTDLPLFAVLKRSQFCEALRQCGQMEKLIRSHPSSILVSYINEPFGNGWGKPHRNLLRPELEAFFLAADQVVRLHNPDRVIKAVDGDYDPPGPGLPDNHCYNTWYNGHGLPIGNLIKGSWVKTKSDWNFACGEFGAEGLDPVETMYKYYPKNWLPDTEQQDWTPAKIVKAQTGNFHYLWFSTPRTLNEWVWKSQQFQAWAVETMTHAFRRNGKMVSFAVHLFIDAFPSGWMKAIMDVERTPKPAYFAYLDALSPILVNLRTDRNTYFSDDLLAVEIWVCNDTHETLKQAKVHYQIRRRGTIVFSNKVKASIPANTSTYQGTLRWRLPNVTQRTLFIVEAALIDADGKTRHSSAYSVTVFPAMESSGTVYILGEKNGAAVQIVAELGLTAKRYTPNVTGVIIADDIDCILAHKQQVEASIAAGARMIVTDIFPQESAEERRFTMADTEITLRKAGMNPRFFVNCRTHHPLAADFEDNDFFMWHNQHTDTIDPILFTTMDANAMEPVLTTGQGYWRSDWQMAFAAGSRHYGKGELILSLVHLAGRIETNPIAKEYARRLLLPAASYGIPADTITNKRKTAINRRKKCCRRSQK